VWRARLGDPIGVARVEREDYVEPFGAQEELGELGREGVPLREEDKE